jgi:hypothetical protein
VFIEFILSHQFRILFMQGGGLAENAIVPMNLSRGGVVDFVVTGSWSQKSAKEARKYATGHIAASNEADAHTTLPDPAKWQVLIKENHIAAAGGVPAVLRRVAEAAPQARFVEIEVETLAQLDEALASGATMVLLDNMDIPTLQEAVRRNAGRAVLEISGGVSLETVRALAETGVDRISIGALTKDVKATDFSLRFDAF